MNKQEYPWGCARSCAFSWVTKLGLYILRRNWLCTSSSCQSHDWSASKLTLHDELSVRVIALQRIRGGSYSLQQGEQLVRVFDFCDPRGPLEALVVEEVSFVPGKQIRDIWEHEGG